MNVKRERVIVDVESDYIKSYYFYWEIDIMFMIKTQNRTPLTDSLRAFTPLARALIHTSAPPEPSLSTRAHGERLGFQSPLSVLIVILDRNFILSYFVKLRSFEKSEKVYCESI